MSSIENFTDTLAEYFDAIMPIPMDIDGWGECKRIKFSVSQINERFHLNVKNEYCFYVLNSGLVVVCTALSKNYGMNDSGFINNYKQNFQKHPYADIEFSFMSKSTSLFGGSSEFCPYIYAYAKNIVEGYNVAMRSQSSDKVSVLNQLYTPMFRQWIEYIERISNEIAKPYSR